MAAIGHLIQPVTVGGVPYCVKHGATTPKWRTASLLTSDMTLNGAEDDDKWDTTGGLEGLTFGTCCIWKATLRFNATGVVPPGVLYEVAINGSSVVAETPGVIGIYDEEIDLNALGLMGRPCGNEWVVTAFFEGTVEIINVTFGPPS